MRLPSSNELRQIGQLTSARELARLADLAQILAQKQSIEARIEDLKTSVLACQDTVQAANLSRWLEWRDHEVERLNSQLALVSADHAQALAHCGKAIAENSVMENLIQRARASETEDREKRELLEQTLEFAEEKQLHLLPNDLGDQNV